MKSMFKSFSTISGMRRPVRAVAALLAAQMVFFGVPASVWAGNLPDVASAGLTDGTDYTLSGNTLTLKTGNHTWGGEGYSIGSGYTVNYDGVAATLERDTSGSASLINGALNSAGSVWILNKAGVVIGNTGSVNVDGFIAAAAGSTDGTTFSDLGSGSVQNLGTINGGKYVYLVGKTVDNSGSISASDVVLAAFGDSGADSLTIGQGENGSTITFYVGTNVVTGTGGTNFSLTWSSTNSVMTNLTLKTDSDLSLATALAAGSNIVVDAGGSVELEDVTADHALQITSAGGAIFQKADTKVRSDVLSLSGNVITLANVGNKFGDITVASGAGNVSITEADAISVAGIERTDGDVTLNAGANGITQSGAIAIDDGALALTGGEIKLENVGNKFGDITVASGAGNVSITEADAISVAGIERTDGDVTLNAGANGITQTGAIAIDDGALALTGGAITLTSTNNAYGKVSATGTDIELVDSRALELGAVTATSNLMVTANGALTGSTNLTVAGASTFNAGTNNITLSGTNALSGAVSLTGGEIKLENVGNKFGDITVASGAGNVSIAEADAISVAGIAHAGGVTLNAGTNAITQTGSIDIGTNALALTGGNITLTNGGNKLGAITVADGLGNVSITEADAISVAGIAHTNGNVTLNAGTNAITQTGAIAIDDGALSLTGGEITLTDANNAYGKVSATGTNIELVDSRALELDDITSTGTLTVTANGALTDSGVLTVDGASTFDVGANDITLDSANKLTGAVALTGANVLVNNAQALTLDNVDASGNFVAMSAGDMTSSGIIDAGGNVLLEAKHGDLLVEGQVDGQNVTLQSSGRVTENASVNAQGDKVVIGDAGIDQNASYTAQNALYKASHGDVKVSGSMSDVSGTLGIEAEGIVTDNGTLKADTLLLKSTQDDVDVQLANGVHKVAASAKDDVTLEIPGAVRIIDGGQVQVQQVQEDGTTKDSSTIKVSGVTAGDKADIHAGGKLSGTTIHGRTVDLSADSSVDMGQITASGANRTTVAGDLHAGTLSGSSVALQARQNADIGTLSGGTISAKVSGNASLDRVQGGSVTLDVDKALDAGTIAGGPIALTVGNNANVGTLDGGNVEADIGGNASLENISGDDVLLNIGGDLESSGKIEVGALDVEEARNVTLNDVTVKTLDAQKVGNVEIDSLKAGELERIASSGSVKIDSLDTTKIGSVSGSGNVSVTMKTAADTVHLGSIESRGGDLTFVSRNPNTSFVDANGGARNLSAAGDLKMDVGGRLGTAADPLEIYWGRTATLTGGDHGGVYDRNFFHAFFNAYDSQGHALDLTKFFYPEVLGYVLINNNLTAAGVRQTRAMNRALAFSVATPELKSVQGVFGDPAFLQTGLGLSEANVLNGASKLTLSEIEYFDLFSGVLTYELGEWSPVAYPKEEPLKSRLNVQFAQPEPDMTVIEPKAKEVSSTSGQSKK